MRAFIRMLLVLVLFVGFAPRAHAQDDYTHTIARIGNVELINHHPACNPFAKAFDPVWIHGEGWTMPRVLWPAMYSTLNLGIAEAVHKLGVPVKVAAIIAPIPLMLLPHLRQAKLGLQNGQVYQLNLLDWVGDAWIRDLPAWAMLSGRTNTARDVGIWAAGTAAFTCVTRP